MEEDAARRGLDRFSGAFRDESQAWLIDLTS